MTYHIEHGNHYDISLSKLDNALNDEDNILRPPRLLTKYFKKIAGKIIRLSDKFILKLLYEKQNRELKNIIKNKQTKNNFYLFGHTHLAEIDNNLNFINTGMVQYGIGQYLVIDENGFDLKNEYYE